VMYRWWDRRYSDRLVAAHRAGQRVRVIADRSQYTQDARFKAEIDYLATRGVQVRITRHKGPTHSKMTVLHARRQMVLATYHPVAGSPNWELHVSVSDDAAFRRAVERFERAWFNADPRSGSFAPLEVGMPVPAETEVEASPPTVCYENPVPDPEPLADSPAFDLCFAPDQNCQRELLAPTIDAEPTRLDFAVYSMSSTWMRDALVRFASRGLPLRLLADGDRAPEPAMRDTLRRIKQAGPANVQIKVDNQSGRSLHMKLLVGSSWLAFGSSNHNPASTTRVRGCGRRGYSDNELILIRDQALQDAARARFDALWASAYFSPFTP
jgi:phosphatidylserine/phosphatidylglycerophosphate/cardiolipin synthase-like enzyme